MGHVVTWQTNFNGGELSPFMYGRFDHDAYKVSLKSMVGFVPRPQGPAEACPGFEFISIAKGPCRLIPFEPYVTQGYVIEASDLTLRFYTNDVQIMLGPLNPYQIAAPWSYAQVKQVYYAQSVDVMYMVHPQVAPQKLERLTASTFAIQPLDLTGGPFDPRNADHTLTVAPSATTGTITLISSSPLFAAGDVDGLFEIEASGHSGVGAWEPGITSSVGELRIWGVNVYRNIGGVGKTGTVAPTHKTGAQYDGSGSGMDINSKPAGGVLWQYEYDLIGRVQITAFTDAQTVTATVIKPLASTTAQWRWRFGSFSTKRGWPSAVCVWNQRLILAKNNVLYGSAAGDLQNFDRFNELGDISLDMAFTVELDNPNPILWLAAASELCIGTDIAEHVIRPATLAQAIGPGNVKVLHQTARGSAPVRPLINDGLPMFLQKNGRKVLQMYRETLDNYKCEDLTRYADHIGNSPFIEFAWQREPLQLIWSVHEDGSLAAASYMPVEQVLGWCRRPLAPGLLAKSICTITSPDGHRDQLWTVADRSSVWMVMQLAPYRLTGGEDMNGLMADAALAYDGPATTHLSGLGHIVGADVVVIADGAVRGVHHVDPTGSVILTVPITKAFVGLEYPAYIETLPVEAGSDNGPAQTKKKRINRVSLRLHQSLGLKLTVQGAPHVLENQLGNSPLETALPFIHGDQVIDVVGDWDREATIRIDRTVAKQSTIIALGQTVEVGQR